MLEMNKQICIGLILYAISFGFIQTNAIASEDTDATGQKAWEDTAELSFVETGGNTEVTTVSAKNTFKYAFSERWATRWRISYLYGETDGETTAERYESDLRLDFNATERAYFYGMAGWLRDEFAGIDDRYYIGPGLGYKFANGPRHFFSTELGASYAKEEYIDGTDSDFMEGRASGQYEFQIDKRLKFGQLVEYYHNLKDTEKYKIKSLTELTAKLSEPFSIKFTYEVRYDSEPTPDTLDNTDTLLSIALVASF